MKSLNFAVCLSINRLLAIIGVLVFSGCSIVKNNPSYDIVQQIEFSGKNNGSMDFIISDLERQNIHCKFLHDFRVNYLPEGRVEIYDGILFNTPRVVDGSDDEVLKLDRTKAALACFGSVDTGTTSGIRAANIYLDGKMNFLAVTKRVRKD